MRAVSGSHVDDESELPGRVFDVLPLELFALRVVGPRQALVHVEGGVEPASDQDEAPTHGLEEETSDQET